MNDTSIDELVNNIDGAFPSTHIFAKNVAKSYRREQFMRDMTLDQGRKLFDVIIRNCEQPPSLGEVQSLYYRYVHVKIDKPKCLICDGNTWISFDENGNRFTFMQDGHEYSYVKPCECRSN